MLFFFDATPQISRAPSALWPAPRPASPPARPSAALKVAHELSMNHAALSLPYCRHRGLHHLADALAQQLWQSGNCRVHRFLGWFDQCSHLRAAFYPVAAPKADVHSQQRFHYMSHHGEVVIDQAHRGYTLTTDTDGLASPNPLYMSYVPGPDGHFNGAHKRCTRNNECSLTAPMQGTMATASSLLPPSWTPASPSMSGFDVAHQHVTRPQINFDNSKRRLQITTLLCPH